MTYSTHTRDSGFDRNKASDQPVFQRDTAALRRLLHNVTGIAARAPAAVSEMVAYVLHWRRARWTVEKLSSLDDATLRGIGIGRSEIVPTAYHLTLQDWEKRRRPRR